MRYKITKKDAEVLLFSVILHKLSHIKMKKSRFYSLFAILLIPLCSFATIDITAIYTDSKGQPVTTTDSFTEEAPLHVRFEFDTSLFASGSIIEWHFQHQSAGSISEVTRYEESPEFDFTQSGLTIVTLLVKEGDEVVDEGSINVTISESHLEMPNAFSPNGDGTNDIYAAKGVCNPESSDHYRSIVSFHAYIFNRWGHKLFEWTDISTGWDGTYNGSPVKDGVYFVVVKARGADGIEYNIRRDVNLIRDFNKTSNGTGGEQ